MILFYVNQLIMVHQIIMIIRDNININLIKNYDNIIINNNYNWKLFGCTILNITCHCIL